MSPVCALSHFSPVLLCNPMDCSPPGSSVHGILQARILEWVAVPSSRGSSPPRDRPPVFCVAGGFFITEPPGKPRIITYQFQFRTTALSLLLENSCWYISCSTPRKQKWGNFRLKTEPDHLNTIIHSSKKSSLKKRKTRKQKEKKRKIEGRREGGRKQASKLKGSSKYNPIFQISFQLCLQLYKPHT